MKKVLIIDDDRIHLFTMQKLIMLTQKGVKIKSYRDGQQALEFLKKNKDNEEVLPDIILLDLNMPGWDGWKYLEEYQNLVPHFIREIDLYIISCSPNPADVTRALNDPNVCDYLSKPLTPETLDRVFKGALVN